MNFIFTRLSAFVFRPSEKSLMIMKQPNFFLFVFRPSSFVLEKKASWFNLMSFFFVLCLSSFILCPWEKSLMIQLNFFFFFLCPSSFVSEKKDLMNEFISFLSSFVLCPLSHMNQPDFFFFRPLSFVLQQWEKRLLNQLGLFFFRLPFFARPLFFEKKRNRNSSSLIPRTKDERRIKRR